MVSHTHILDHPLLGHKLSLLRCRDTGTKDFRALTGEIAMLLCCEATRGLAVEAVEIQTPVAAAKGLVLAGKKPVFVPILRAGLGMLDGALALMPTAKVGHIGLCRDPATLEPAEYYCKLPDDIHERDVFILDPMLATGGSASAAVSVLKRHGVTRLRLISVIAAPEGIARLTADHPDVEVYCAALDDRLDEHGYIVPGLGDAGDRIFGTE